MFLIALLPIVAARARSWARALCHSDSSLVGGAVLVTVLVRLLRTLPGMHEQSDRVADLRWGGRRGRQPVTVQR
jgi:hypothetical protein